MTLKVATFIGCAAMVLSPFGFARGEEAAADAAAPQADPELDNEIAYVQALVDNAYPDFAEPVIEATKKRWPASEARLFAIEIRGLLSLSRFEEAEKRIAALPDRKSTKYWAARLEIANNYFARQMKDEGRKIYDEFFAAFPKPPADIRDFYIERCYQFGQLLYEDKQYEKAAQRYETLLKEVKDDTWCDLAGETAKIYLKLADEAGKGKGDKFLAAAEKLVDKLLWHLEKPVYFGQAVSMKAHIAEMRGNIERAEAIIDEHKSTLQDLHEQIVQNDPDGRAGLLKLSPLPECLYLQAKMLWNAAQEEYKQPKHDDEKVKSYLFGPKPKGGGKRDVSKGAFAMAVNVFFKYDMSPWSASAGELSEDIRAFAEKNYGAKIKTKITPEMIAKARAAKFKDAHDLFIANKYVESIAAYYEALAKYPEIPESIEAISCIISSLQDLIVESGKDAAKRDEYRLDADAIEGYLAERFCENRDRTMMINAGNALFAAAAKEQERGDAARADRLYTAFYTNYRAHPNAPTLAASKAGEAQKAERWADAIAKWEIIERCYTNSTFYAPALSQLSYCWGKLGDRAKEIAYINRYLPLEQSKVRRLQAQMTLAQMYQKDGLDILASADTNATPEAVAAAEKAGSAQIIRAIQQFTKFSTESEKEIADPSTTKVDREKYLSLREAALFMVGECYARINRPEAALAKMRERAAASYENYLKTFPDGQWAKVAYVKLGTIYTAMGDMMKSKDALDRLAKKFPDSDEAKNAMPRLAKSLVELGLRKEGTEIYADMLRTDGKYSAGQYLNAGEALIVAKSWDLANQAFEKSIRLAGTNFPQTVARARLGQAKSSFKQGSLAEAREALDLFLNDPNPKISKSSVAADANLLLAEVASEQGRTEKDATMRGKMFGAAIGAVKKLRTYWKAKPQWEQDRIDLLSGDILVRRMNAEEAMGLKEEAMETCGRAASTFQVFLQAHGVGADKTIEQLTPGELENLERAYGTMVPLFAKMGSEQADRVLKYGGEYLQYFPNGKFRTAIGNCINQAKADLPAGTAAGEPAPAPAAEAPAEAPAAE